MSGKRPFEFPAPTEPSIAEGFPSFDSEKMKAQAEAIAASVEGIQTARPVPEAFLFLAAMKRIPFLASLLESVDDAGLDLSEIVSGAQTRQGFQLGSLALSAIDFLKIPLIYLAAFLLSEKLPPFNLSRGVKWLYSGIGLGLGIAMLVLPGAFPFIATVGGILGVVVGAMSLGKLFLDRATTRDKLNAVQVDIEKARTLQTEIITKKKEFDGIINDMTISKTKRELKANRVLIDLQGLEIRFDRFKLQELLNNEARYDAKLKKMASPVRVMDKSIGVVLAILGLAGAITLFVAPPVGLGILAAASLLGGAYFLARVATPWVKKSLDWFKTKLNPAQSRANELEKEETKAPEPANKLDPRHSPEALVETILHPSSENQEIVDEVLADAKKLQSRSSRSTSGASLPLATPIDSSSSDVDSVLNDAPNQDSKNSLTEDKKANSNAEASAAVEDKGVSHDEEDKEGEGEGEGEGEKPGRKGG